jgi:hypothetical protein
LSSKARISPLPPDKKERRPEGRRSFIRKLLCSSRLNHDHTAIIKDDLAGALGNAGTAAGALAVINAGQIVHHMDSVRLTSLLTELYYLTGDKQNLHNVVKIFEGYYVGGGAHFYPNGLSPYRTLKAYDQAGMTEEGKKIFDFFVAHTDNMIKVGPAYPKHEVNYEQTIVTPAATFISEMGKYTGDEKYTVGAKGHIINLERFGGKQPSFHLYDTPIRYWDGYWFGKKRLWGDVFPHYWSCLSARSFTAFGDISGDKKYKKMAEENMRNCLCLFTPDGRGSAAYMYPHTCNGVDGEFYDVWANDQDFALYFAMMDGIFE